MNVLYAGYREWSFEVLKSLAKTQGKYKISGVITTKESEVDFSKLGIKTYVIDPNKLLGTKAKLVFQKHKPEVILFYGWSWMIPEEIYKKYNCLIYHISPLPKYRGGSPIQHQIINGETESAGTILKAVKEVDAGPIYSQSPISLKGSMEDILKRIVLVGIKDSKFVLSGIASGKITPVPQDEKKKSVYKRRKPEESEIKLSDFRKKTSKELYDFIRALSDPYPNAFIVCKDGKRLYLTDAKLDNS